MKSHRIAVATAMLLAGNALTPSPALAGPYTDDLSKCLVANTTESDKTTLMTWIFAAISLNPTVAPMAHITPAKRKQINADMGKLFMSLMTETCRSQSQAAYKYEGNSALETSFSVLGQVAGRELFSSPEVAKGMGELDAQIDKKKLQEVFGSDK